MKKKLANIRPDTGKTSWTLKDVYETNIWGPNPD